MALDSMRRYSWTPLGLEKERVVVTKPVSHEVLIVLGVATVKLCIVKVVPQLCFQPTTSYDAFLLFLSFVLLSKQSHTTLHFIYI